MTALRDPPHYLSLLKTTRTPKRLLWLDCTPQSTTDDGSFTDSWLSGALGGTHWTARTNTQKDWMNAYDTADDLWRAADDFCKEGRRVVLFTYDLPYQLRVSQALVSLPALGWKLEHIVLERGAAWASFHHGRRSLLMCDLRSWTPVEFRKIRADVGAAGGPGVAGDDPERQTGDASVDRAEVVRAAVLEILAWIQAENLGPFRPTGSGQSYGAFRRRFLHHRIMIHDDTDLLQVERQAMWTGRAEAWRHGKLTKGPFVEYDMKAAYCTIARDCEVPVHVAGEIPKPTPEKVLRSMERYAVLAYVTVDTDVPCVPTRLGEHTVWPVGKFSSWLWDPELALAFKHAKSVTVNKAIRYIRAPALRDFASWTLDMLDNPDLLPAPICHRIVKHWSRTLVGRLGLRYRSWQKFGTHPVPDLRLVTFLDHVDGIKTDMLIVGTERLMLGALEESAESCPQIPGWVMSMSRRILWDEMSHVGLDRVVYVDTDSIIMGPRGPYSALRPGYFHPNITWNEKGRYGSMNIHGPRNIECDTDRRIAGLPLTARQSGPLEFQGHVLRSIRESMRAGELDSVANIARTFTFDPIDVRREHNVDGTTQPFRLEEQCS